jgi:hypothetical protein
VEDETDVVPAFTVPTQQGRVTLTQ